jgi:hypothetical protein
MLNYDYQHKARMKIVFKSAGYGNEKRKAMLWVALKDKKNVYHCHVDGSHSSKNIVLAGHVIYKSERGNLIRLLQKEGHTL